MGALNEQVPPGAALGEELLSRLPLDTPIFPLDLSEENSHTVGHGGFFWRWLAWLTAHCRWSCREGRPILWRSVKWSCSASSWTRLLSAVIVVGGGRRAGAATGADGSASARKQRERSARPQVAAQGGA